MMMRTLTGLALTAGVIGCFLAGSASGQDADKKQREAAVKAVAAAEMRLNRVEKLARERAATTKELVIARYQLLDARYQLAQIDREPQKVLIGYLRQIVAIYQNYYDLMSRLETTGKVSQLDVDGARLGLAEANIRLKMHGIIDIHERQVERFKKLITQKAATTEQLEEAQKALRETRRRLAELPR